MRRGRQYVFLRLFFRTFMKLINLMLQYPHNPMTAPGSAGDIILVLNVKLSKAVEI